MTTHVPFPALRTLSKAVFLDDDGGFISTLKLILYSKLVGSFHTDRESAMNVLAASAQAIVMSVWIVTVVSKRRRASAKPDFA